MKCERLNWLFYTFSIPFSNEIFQFRVLFDSHKSFSIWKMRRSVLRSHPAVLDKEGERRAKLYFDRTFLYDFYFEPKRKSVEIDQIIILIGHFYFHGSDLIYVLHFSYRGFFWLSDKSLFRKVVPWCQSSITSQRIHHWNDFLLGQWDRSESSRRLIKSTDWW